MIQGSYEPHSEKILHSCCICTPHCTYTAHGALSKIGENRWRIRMQDNSKTNKYNEI